LICVGVCWLRAVHSESVISSSTTSGLRVSSPRRRSCRLGGPWSTFLRSLPDRRSIERGPDSGRNPVIAPLCIGGWLIFADGGGTQTAESVSITRFGHHCARLATSRTDIVTRARARLPAPLVSMFSRVTRWRGKVGVPLHDTANSHPVAPVTDRAIGPTAERYQRVPRTFATRRSEHFALGRNNRLIGPQHLLSPRQSFDIDVSI
jgi:hypothetical protein